MSSNNAVIKTDNLTKRYDGRGGGTLALNDLTLSVQPGEVFGYLGPNGAGKTTTIRLLLDLIRPTRGSATVLGMDANAQSVELHRRIGFLPGELNLWKNQTARQIVRYLANVRGMSDTRYANELAERLQFDMSKRVRDYSSGNRRKLGLIIALMHKPELLILDEPTNGLDPLMQQTFNQMVQEIRNEGRTVFLSSHVLSEVQAICDRVGILRDGELKAVERVSDLTRAKFRWVTMRFREPASAAMLNGVEGVQNVQAENNTLKLQLMGDFDPLLRAINNHYVVDVRVVEPSLEEIFLTFYGNGETLERTRA